MKPVANSHPALRIGLTGGIGSGKSTVAALLRHRGAFVIDADAIARASTLCGGSALSAIVDAFGADFIGPDGGLNRQRMRDHVFAQPEARRVLETIIHPFVGTEVQRLTASTHARCLVFDVPLLVESPHWRHQLDRVLVVDCSHATQIRRVSQRNGWDKATIDAVIRSQSPREQRLAAADWVLFNDTDQIEALQRCVKGLAQRFGL
ncbi:MAG: dephospho-CoA kinase [Hydrogenophaga sp.]|uniref:dephospho-CoA kinase n=1 Tax=Hydrogenophaga sp. TaxID=1904254 RepID=UPI0027702822|nr:dephospho-CoA kinase [Hydrogenophaga sp.]MDP2419502.1 dephospho-CoA kinase [Hydrogenophaga sp.]MDZ4189666.1 dephospho-CoA kinase [Hydrogenophaga sp.]